MQPLDIVYCKDCKYYRSKIVDSHSTVYECLLSKDLQIENPSLYCNKPCYKKPKTKSKPQAKKK